MSVYLVSYDLKRPTQNYAGLYEELKKASGWWHYLDSTWLISSSETLGSWQKRIRAKVDENDAFIIIELSQGARRNGWLPKRAWEWLRKHLD